VSCCCRLCACLYPVECTVEIQIYSSRIGVRVVSTNLLSKSTITWCSCVSDYDTIKSVALTTAALKSDLCCHCLKFNFNLWFELCYYLVIAAAKVLSLFRTPKYFSIYFFYRASLACFYVKAVLFLQEKRMYSPSYKTRLYILSSLLCLYLFLHVDELSLAVVEFVLQESEFL